MPIFFKKLYEQFSAVLKEVNGAQRVTIALLGAMVFIVLLGITVWGLQPDYVVLYSGLEQQDTGEIVRKLEDKNIKYKIGPNGSSVSVPSKYVRSLRVELATDGLPKAKGTGYEIFDQLKLGVTEFTQKVNYQRALETELARTISSLSQIRAARVHLVMPEEELFVADKQKTSASLVLDLVGMDSLSGTQVNGLVHLMATSVKGLSPKDITIVDTKGNVLYSEDEESFESGLSLKQLEVQKQYEKNIEKNISTMLNQVFGANSSVVRVSVFMDFDKSETESEIYLPSEEPLVRSERYVEEGFRGTNTNTPLQIAAPGADRAGDSDYNKVDETRNFEISKRIERFKRAPGKISKVTVAVILDREITNEQRSQLLDALTNAAGVDAERGDVITLSSFVFDRSSKENYEKEFEKARRQEFFYSLGRNVFLAIVLIALALFALSRFKKIKNSAVNTSTGRQYEYNSRSEIPVLGGEDLIENVAMSDEQIHMKKVKYSLEDMLNNDPEVFTQLLRQWLKEE